MRNNKPLIIIAGLFIVFIALAIFLLGHSHHAGRTTPPKLEHGSATSTVGLDGTQRLSDILTTKQFVVVKQALSSYMRATISSSLISASIVPGTTVVNNDGSINFTVKIENPSQTFSVLLQRSNPSVIIFSVVGANSEPETLYPYGQ